MRPCNAGASSAAVHQPAMGTHGGRAAGEARPPHGVQGLQRPGGSCRRLSGAVTIAAWIARSIRKQRRPAVTNEINNIMLREAEAKADQLAMECRELRIENQQLQRELEAARAQLQEREADRGEV